MTWGTTLELDDDGELVFNDDNTMQTITGRNKVQQDLKILLRTEYGEDIFHPSFGMNMMNVIRVSTKASVEKELRDALGQYQYLEEIVEIDANVKDIDQRQIEVDATVKVSEDVQIKLRVMV